MKNDLHNTLLETGFAKLPGTGDFKKTLVKPLTVPQNMNNETIAPPPYVWDRISRILDSQDNQKLKFKKARSIEKKTQVAILGGLIAGAAFAVFR